ncbi:hypothetical protein J6Y50_03755 [bacterium]|nr:hypothetical protein [bacterium]
MQHYFVFLSFEVLSCMDYDRDFIHGELEELGLYAQIRLENTLQPLPEGTFIGEYKFEDKEGLKNTIYTEVSALFSRHGVGARLFIAVSEKATIGVEDMNPAPKI